MLNTGDRPYVKDAQPLRIEIEPGEDSTTGPCPCCGNETSTIWGFVYVNSFARAVYYIRWAVGIPDHSATIAMSIGRWGEASSASDRQYVGLDYRVRNGVPEFMVVDAESTPWSHAEPLGTKLTRDQVVGTDLAQEAFEILDVIVAHDPRLQGVMKRGR